MEKFFFQAMVITPILWFAEFLDNSVGFLSFTFLAGIISTFAWQRIDRIYEDSGH